MAYRVNWIVKHCVLYNSLSGDLTLDDLRDSSKVIADHMDDAYNSASKMVIGIIDVREAKVGLLVRSVISTAVQEIASVIDARVWKAKPGFVVLITTSDAAKLLTSLVISLSKQPMTSVGTMTEALQVVHYMYPELQAQIDEYARKNLPAEKTT